MFLCLRIVYKYLEKNFNLYWEGRGGESCSSLVRQGPALTGEIKFSKLSKQKIKSFRIQFHFNRSEYCVPLFRRHLQQICWVVFTGCPDCFITFYEIVYTNRCSTSSSSSLGRNVKTSLRLYQELLEISDQKWQPTAALEIGNLSTSTRPTSYAAKYGTNKLRERKLQNDNWNEADLLVYNIFIDLYLLL